MTDTLLTAGPLSKNDVGTFPRLLNSGGPQVWIIGVTTLMDAIQGTVEILLASGFRLGVSVSKVSAFGGLQGALIGDL